MGGLGGVKNKIVDKRDSKSRGMEMVILGAGRTCVLIEHSTGVGKVPKYSAERKDTGSEAVHIPAEGEHCGAKSGGALYSG